MNIDGRGLVDVCDINNTNNISKNASVLGNSVEFVNSTGAFFDGENAIKKAENTKDAYDRIVDKSDSDKAGEMAITTETIEKLADVVTPDNYSKYQVLGIEPDKDDPANILTVSERIEIELAQTCDNYKPVGNIDVKDLEQMYGSTGRAYEIKREVSEYLLVNNMPLTAENIYKAEYSVSGETAEKYSQLDDSEWESLKPQIEKMLDNSGLEVSDRNLDNAKWLVEEKIPVTTDNLYTLTQIDKINDNGDYYDAISATSVEAMEIIANGNEEQITTLVLDNKDVTLLNMKRLSEDRSNEANQDRKEQLSEKQQQLLTMSKKNLEELRLKMTVEASVMMMKKGINVEITALSDLVKELRSQENEYAENIFAITGNVSEPSQVELFTDTTEIMKQFSATPSYIMGSVLNDEINFQVSDMVDEGKNIQNKLMEAQEAYDTLGTKPDKELGDSLNKAFANIDDMLRELGEDITPDNQRAVRILAYNSMEITQENITSVREMDMQVTRLIDNLTPRTTAYLITNGINPLKTNINELNDELDDINEEIGVDEVEKYSEFLWKLDKNKAISDEDREAYIGIYRLINMVEKGDRRAIGALAKQQREMTMNNLLQATRSFKQTGKEVVVDDEYGVAEEVRLADNNIDNQLIRWESNVFLKRAKDVISPDNIHNSLKKNDEDMTFSEFVEKMAQTNQDNMEEETYYNQLRSQEISSISNISEEVLINIVEDGVPKNMENMIGISYYILNGDKTFSKIQSVCEDEKVDSDIEKLESMIGDETEEETYSGKIKEMCEDINTALLNKSHISVEDIRGISKMTGYIKRATDKNSYYVPVEIQGEKTTMKITLNTGTEDKGQIDIKINRVHRKNQEDIQLQISMKHGDVKALVSSGEEDKKHLEQLETMLSEECDRRNIKLKSFGMVNESIPVSRGEYDKEDSDITTKELFDMAKVVIGCVKNCFK